MILHMVSCISYPLSKSLEDFFNTAINYIQQYRRSIRIIVSNRVEVNNSHLAVKRKNKLKNLLYIIYSYCLYFFSNKDLQ